MICALNPKILLKSSVLKPFITDMTMIKTATPKAMPKKEKIEIIFKKPSFLFGLKYLKAIFFFQFRNQIIFF